MKKPIFAALCLSGTLAFATGVAAQDSANANRDEKGQKHTMTVTGCLREAPGTTGEYELANATGEKGAAATSTYRLTATSSVNLKEHLGHKVEIKGTMAGSEKSPTSTASGTEKIEVTSLKHISPTCEAGSTK
jgi:hypothetical protein